MQSCALLLQCELLQAPTFPVETFLHTSIIYKSSKHMAMMLRCLQSCQRKGWKSHHKAECKIFAEENIEDMFLCAALRVLCMRKLGTINDVQWHWVNRMQSHIEDYCHREPGFEQTMSEAAAKAIKWTGMGDSEENVRELYCRVSPIKAPRCFC